MSRVRSCRRLSHRPSSAFPPATTPPIFRPFPTSSSPNSSTESAEGRSLPSSAQASSEPPAGSAPPGSRLTFSLPRHETLATEAETAAFYSAGEEGNVAGTLGEEGLWWGEGKGVCFLRSKPSQLSLSFPSDGAVARWGPSWRSVAQPLRLSALSGLSGLGALSARQKVDGEIGFCSDRTARVGRLRGGGGLAARCLGQRAEGGGESADVADGETTAQLEKSPLADESVAATCINAIRMLVVDAVNAVNAGHPGSAMGLAPLGALLFAEEMRFDPADPAWPNRDRFILSNGHVCLLQYCLLHLTGYNLQMEDLKRLAKLGSKTPGHPENTLTPGIEVTTGPLGQGFANAVGVAAAEAHLAARLNSVDFPDLIDHHTFVVFGDGCAMEGVVNEAASLAGHWGLGKLIAFYDSNQVTIDGSTALAFSEDVLGRFAALRWHVQRITLHDAADLDALRTAIQAAKSETHRPSVIQVDTVIGFGSPKKQGTSAAHHGAFGKEETEAIKKELHWPYNEPFTVPEEVYRVMHQAAARGQSAAASWRDRAAQYRQRHPDRAALLDALTVPGRLPAGWEDSLPHFEPATPPDATRGYSEACLNGLVHSLPNLLGGSADLASSNKVSFHGLPDFSRDCFEGRNFHYGVREHAMAAISYFSSTLFLQPASHGSLPLLATGLPCTHERSSQ
ncbi:unnamed protein product [Closterium sp. Naga37s-1]|nr:unnamed protein product [Closterium sp. Naga37s-1]